MVYGISYCTVEKKQKKVGETFGELNAPPYLYGVIKIISYAILSDPRFPELPPSRGVKFRQQLFP
jgi:hypothetical protein